MRQVSGVRQQGRVDDPPFCCTQQSRMAPLDGIRVVSIALNAPGPVAASRLRAHGAAVIKVEPPAGDPLSAYCPAWYAELHEQIAVERLDLKSDAGQSRMRVLLERADLFLSSQRPSALARLRLDPPNLPPGVRALNIVGELARPEVAGHDLTYLARAGLLGHEMPRTLVADVLGAEHAFAMALLLLRQPAGSHAQVGLFDSLAPLMAARKHGLTGPRNLLGGKLPAYGLYETRDGRIAVAALEPRFRARLYEQLRLPEGSALDNAFRARTAAEWERWAEERDLPLSVVRDL
jgi:alpha-methylacyl-CoA racemase